MIPGWMANGDLPAGVHKATWREIERRLVFNSWRKRLFGGLRVGCRNLLTAGCRLVFLDRSFLTKKENPADYDACWDVRGVDEGLLDPVFWDFSKGRAAQKMKYFGEFFPAQLPEGATGKAFLDFFQTNKETGRPKGILAIRLRRQRR